MRKLRPTIQWLLIITAVSAVVLNLPFAYFKITESGSIPCGLGKSVETKSMPIYGDNFSSYCIPCISALRTFGRSDVIDTVLNSFDKLARLRPETKLVYGEIGYPFGGRIRPHRTHREGSSVDLMVPLKDGIKVDTNVFNRFGYDLEFDSEGHLGNAEIDFEAMAVLISTLSEEAAQGGGRVRRIFFAPDIQPKLFATNLGKAFKSTITFNENQAWVRHDEHFHVDFEFPCR